MTALPPMQQVPRALPANLDAEQELLGAILINNGAFHRVAGFLRAEHFFHEGHRRIYEACATLIERGERADPVKLKAHFERDDVLAKIGGTPYLAQLAKVATTVINAEDYARVVHDLALRRETIAILERRLERAYDPRVEEPAGLLIEGTEAELRAIPDHGRTGGMVQVGDAAGEVVERAAAMLDGAQRPGLSTGFKDLDWQLGGGLFPKSLYLLAGRPSMGKSALVSAIADNAASAGIPVAFFSLEMSKDELAVRIVGARCRLPYVDIRRGNISREDVQAMRKVRRDLDALPLHIDDRSSVPVAGMRSAALRLSIRQKVGLIVVDYLQITKPREGRADRLQQISEISADLKALAKDLDCPVLALSQLSRAVESRDGKRPQLSDLRESGAIEQDADAVAFVFREEYYLEREPKDSNDAGFLDWNRKLQAARNRCDVLVQKNRQGPVGDVSLYFDPPTGRFANWSER